tara:strand:- start:1542 stop:1973 length:432 start_codon:yes stop_codon:yes gene_type:complete
MGNLMKYNATDLNQFLDLINRNSIGMEDYFDRLTKLPETTNYPPYNLVQVSAQEFRLELALAGFKQKEINVYTQDGKLFVEGTKEEPPTEKTFIHRGVAARSFTRTWSLSDETEVGSVVFEDGLLTVTLQKIVPDYHKRKDYL